jgi:ADP-ribose pyrophosphatase YjhB (NUDIX family)
MREETGLEVCVGSLLYVGDRIDRDQHVLHITLAVERVGGRLEVGVEPEPDANPIWGVEMVRIESLCEYGFSPRFRDLALAGFPRKGSYVGSVANIGL